MTIEDIKGLAVVVVGGVLSILGIGVGSVGVAIWIANRLSQSYNTDNIRTSQQFVVTGLIVLAFGVAMLWSQLGPGIIWLLLGED
jgi:branched-subunit amino acid ABC-type transport system permease component